MGDKTLLHSTAPCKDSKSTEKSSREVIWKQISEGEIPPSNGQVIALIDYGMGIIQYQACYGPDLMLGRKQDAYCGAKHERDWWAILPPPPGHRYSERLKRIININNRFEDEV